MGIFWLFLLLILLVVPAILNYDPLFIWNNPILDVPSYTLIMVAVCSAINVTYIFREYRDDGTELIIVSKPLERWKILIAKLLVYLTITLVMVVACMLIFIFTFAFGQKRANHITGVDFKVLGASIGSFVLGCFICSLFFGAIGIIISLISGKVGILISTIGFSIVINVIYLIMPILVTDINDYLESKYGNHFISVNYYSTKDNHQHTAVTMDYLGDHDLKYYAQDANKNNHNDIASYFNISQQIALLYKSLNGNNNDAYKNSAYGSYVNQAYKIDCDNNVILNDLPVVTTDIYSNEHVDSIGYHIYGMNLGGITNLALSLLGIPSSTMCLFQPQETSLVLSASNIQYFTTDEITNHTIKIDHEGLDNPYEEDINKWKFIVDDNRNGELTKWLAYLEYAFHVNRVPTDASGTIINKSWLWNGDNDPKWSKLIFGEDRERDGHIPYNNWFEYMINNNENDEKYGWNELPEWTNLNSNNLWNNTEEGLLGKPSISLAKALLGKEINWNNTYQAQIDINQAECQFKWLTKICASKIFYDVYKHRDFFNQNNGLYDDTNVLKFYNNVDSPTGFDVSNNDYALYLASDRRREGSLFYYFKNGLINNYQKYIFQWENTTIGDQSINNLYTYSSSPYVSNEGAIIFWTSFGIVLFIVAIVIYSKTDFK